jgi:hypothetical protein
MTTEIASQSSARNGSGGCFEQAQSIQRDEFASATYLDPNARLPRIQALRGMSAQTCGYFISTEQLAKSGWLDFDLIADDLIDYTYESSGNTEQGLLLQSPKMLVCPRTPVLAFDRAATNETQQLVIVGTYKREYKEDDNLGNTQCFEVFLLDEMNQPMHSFPLSYWAKGANQATFSLEWQKLIDEVTACHAIENQIPARGKNNLFKSLCVFSFRTARELVGKKQKSFACRVVEHDVPNINNWRSYFVGFETKLKTQVWEGLQPYEPLIVPGHEVAALPYATLEE